MQLTHITLTGFKNIADASLDLSPKLNCFLGDNAMGKSNMLDAIYYLSFCKSFTGVTDPQLIGRDGDFAMISGDYLRHDIAETVAVGLRKGRRKSFRRGGKEYQRLSEHIGRFPLVLVSPADMSLVDGAAEERRRFADMVISQTDARYLDSLIRYNRALEQRNSMLRNGVVDPLLYEAVEVAMDSAAAYICTARAQWTASLAEIFRRFYTAVAGDAEIPEITYRSHLLTPKEGRLPACDNDSLPGCDNACEGLPACATENGDSSPQILSLADKLRESLQRDLILKHTTVGPHRDDLEMTLSGLPVRRVASQGQAKTYTVALRFAQYEFLSRATGMKPLLLLDDIFDKLDARRVEHIIEVVSGDTFGQIFITDTNRKHLDEIFARMGGDYAIWSVDHGVFKPL